MGGANNTHVDTSSTQLLSRFCTTSSRTIGSLADRTDGIGIRTAANRSSSLPILVRQRPSNQRQPEIPHAPAYERTRATEISGTMGQGIGCRAVVSSDFSSPMIICNLLFSEAQSLTREFSRVRARPVEPSVLFFQADSSDDDDDESTGPPTTETPVSSSQPAPSAPIAATSQEAAPTAPAESVPNAATSTPPADSSTPDGTSN